MKWLSYLILFTLQVTILIALNYFVVWIHANQNSAVVASWGHLTWIRGYDEYDTIKVNQDFVGLPFPPGWSIAKAPAEWEIYQPPFISNTRGWFKPTKRSAPLGTLCLPVAAICIYLIWRASRGDRQLGLSVDLQDGECEMCKFNLTGNVSGRCPECGTSIRRISRHAKCGQCGLIVSLEPSAAMPCECKECKSNKIIDGRCNNPRIPSRKQSEYLFLAAAIVVLLRFVTCLGAIGIPIVLFKAIKFHIRSASEEPRYDGYKVVRSAILLCGVSLFAFVAAILVPLFLPI